jgi:hypothetical protein
MRATMAQAKMVRVGSATDGENLFIAIPTVPIETNGLDTIMAAMERIDKSIIGGPGHRPVGENSSQLIHDCCWSRRGFRRGIIRTELVGVPMMEGAGVGGRIGGVEDFPGGDDTHVGACARGAGIGEVIGG